MASGLICGVAASITARAALTTSIIFAPTLLRTSSTIACSPLTRDQPSACWNVRRTTATSPKRILRPSRALIGIFTRSSTDSRTPGTLTTSRPPPSSIAPAVTSWLLLLTRRLTVAGSSPYASIAAASTRISSTSLRSPPMSTFRIPGTDSSRSLMRRAACTIWRSGTGPYSAAVSTGNSEKLISITFGSSASAGNSGLASSTALRTSAIALSMSSPAANSSDIDP